MDQMSGKIELVYTIKDLCRVCYTCVRECPVKAEAYEKLLNGDPYKGFINYDCPAIVSGAHPQE